MYRFATLKLAEILKSRRDLIQIERNGKCNNFNFFYKTMYVRDVCAGHTFLVKRIELKFKVLYFLD